MFFVCKYNWSNNGFSARGNLEKSGGKMASGRLHGWGGKAGTSRKWEGCRLVSGAQSPKGGFAVVRRWFCGRPTVVLRSSEGGFAVVRRRFCGRPKAVLGLLVCGGRVATSVEMVLLPAWRQPQRSALAPPKIGTSSMADRY